MLEVTQDILKTIYKKRVPPVKKYNFGLLTVVGGSDFYSGSPALSALAAFKSGVDMVNVIAPQRAADIIASFKPDLAAYPLKDGWLTKKHLATLISMIESAKTVSQDKTALVVGGGMGRSTETQEAILELLSQISAPVVIDADAIHALSKNPQIVSGKNFLITPHTYEFYILTGKEVFHLPEEEKIKIVKEEASRLNATILLKGQTDIISDGKEVALNKTGTPLMTVGGTGDTLAGICGALLARGADCLTSACAGAYINGAAGELAGKKYGEGMMATDLIEEIPNVLPKTV